MLTGKATNPAQRVLLLIQNISHIKHSTLLNTKTTSQNNNQLAHYLKKFVSTSCLLVTSVTQLTAQCLENVAAFILPTRKRDPSRVFQLRLFERLYERATLLQCETVAVLFLLNELAQLLSVHLPAILGIPEAKCT
jgi:hypothetical protein